MQLSVHAESESIQGPRQSVPNCYREQFESANHHVQGGPLEAGRIAREYPSASPDRYFNKRPWGSLANGAGVTRAPFEELVLDSYDLALASERRKGN